MLDMKSVREVLNPSLHLANIFQLSESLLNIQSAHLIRGFDIHGFDQLWFKTINKIQDILKENVKLLYTVLPAKYSQETTDTGC